jgi:hypothetical protein
MALDLSHGRRPGMRPGCSARRSRKCRHYTLRGQPRRILLDRTMMHFLHIPLSKVASLQRFYLLGLF